LGASAPGVFRPEARKGEKTLDVHIVAAGRLDKSAPEQSLYEDYARRFQGLALRLGFGPIHLHEVPGRGKSAALELKALEAAIPAGARRVALDPTGKALTSEGFAAHLAKLRDQGVRSTAFLIGGAEGLGSLRDSAQDRIALGLQTWPHLLVRVMLAEQLYRAATILTGHPYHRG
jgi:23S rRNA (pseudouridine1915-N3)-methyltransferase